MSIIIGNKRDNLLVGTSSDDIILGAAGDDTIYGGNGNNLISGGAGDDVITAGSGNDIIDGGGGDDVIDAGEGNNIVDGGGGADWIKAGSGDDIITGGRDDDTIDAGNGNNIILGGGGNDTITAGDGNDVISGGSGNDIISAGKGNNTIRGGGGNDTITSGSGADDIVAGDGNDTISAGDGNNVIDARKGNDVITSGSGNDSIDAGDGNDLINSGGGSDSVDAGKGNDVVVYVVAQNAGAHDVFDGNKGSDTLRLVLSSAEATSSAILADIQHFQQFLASNANANKSNGGTFHFSAFDLSVRNFEALDVVIVGGGNTPAVIGTPTVADVTEDVASTLTAIGSISVTDVDQGQAAFQTAVTGAAGNLGSLSLAANGSYSYSVANSAAQYLGGGESKVDTFTVTSLDGTTKQVSFTIHGVNDSAVIGTPTVADVTEDAASTLTATGSISISDTDQGQAAFQTAVAGAAGNLGSLSLAADGSYSYSVDNSAVQYLGGGESKVDTFTVTSLDGTTKQVSFTIHGVNDSAVIGTPTLADVTEDAASTLTATGSISISDADQGQAVFQTAVTGAAGNLGSLSLAANGSYSYSVANGAVQYLGAGESKVDTFTVTSLDGTTKQVSFTIHGVNDTAVIGTPTVADVTEDAAATLTATGSISISDADQGQAAFQTSVTGAVGNLGSLSLAANGSYSYSVANNAVQYLGAGDSKVDTFTVTSLDGTTKQVNFTIHGVNDSAVIGTPTVADVTEDAASTLTAIGSFSISDADQGQAAFQTAVTGAPGNLGSLSLAADGTYSYSVANSAAQYLGGGESKVDTFTVTSLDGTTKQVSFTIHGVNDTAVIGTPTVADVTEDAASTLTATGSISISDADQGQAGFQTAVTGAAGNLGSLSLAADGSYSYSVDNSAVQYLGGGESKVDTFTVTSLEGTARQVSFTVHGVNDAPGSLALDGATIDAGKGGAQVGVVSLVDADASDVAFSYTVSDARFEVVAQDGGGALLKLKGDDSNGVAIDAQAEQSISLTVTATDQGGLSTSSTFNIGVKTVGASIDGYIKFATVTDGTVSTQTDEFGNFSLVGASGPLQLSGGIDISTGLAFTGVLRAPPGSSVITPLTTLVMAVYDANPGMSYADANQLVLGRIGLSGSNIDLASFDPVAASISSDTTVQSNGGAAIAAAIQIQNTIVQAAALLQGAGATEADATAAVVAQIAMQGGSLSDPNAISSIITNAASTTAGVGTISQGVIDSATQIVSASNGLASTAAGSASGTTLLTTLAQISVVAQSDGSSALSSAGSTGTVPPSVQESLTTNLQASVDNQASYVAQQDVLGINAGQTVTGTTGSDNLVGFAGDDTLQGLAGNDVLKGGDGNDTLDGGADIDRAIYSDATGAISVNMAAGTVSGAGVGTDLLRSIELVSGSKYDDTYNATGFGGNSANAGSNGTFNEFEGRGGNDTITGNGATRISYLNATAAVTVNLALGVAQGTASGDLANVGIDSFSGVTQARGSAFDDTLLGSANNDQFEGRGGSDLISGGAGNDRARYDFESAAIQVNLAAGTVAGGDAGSGGFDTLQSVEMIRGSNFADTYNASGFGSGSTNAGSNGTFNEFEGMGGADTITGNGNTQIAFYNATAGVTVNLATGTATGDSSVGTDSITGGVSRVAGSQFADTITGSNASETFTGNGGDDVINGGAGTDMAVYTGSPGGYTITATSVQDNTANRDGTDSLSGIEILQFGNGGGAVYRLIASGSAANPINATSLGFSGTAGLSSLTGADDFLTIGQNFFGRPINLGAGAGDTINLGVAGAGYTLDLAGVEFLKGAGGNEFVALVNTVSGMSIDLGGGTDTINLAGGANAISVFNTESVNGSDFSGSSDDTLTLLNNVTGVSVNLGNGVNALNLAAGANTFESLFNLSTINGSAADDALSVTNGLSNNGAAVVVNLGDGTDTLNLGGPFNVVSVSGVEYINGGSADDYLVLANNVSGLSVDLGAGVNVLNVADGANSVTVANVGTINGSDFLGSSDDSLTLLNNVSGVAVNLGNGYNTLHLTSGSNDFSSLFGVNAVFGGAGDDILTVHSGLFSNGDAFVVDLGDGADTLVLGHQFNTANVIGVEQIVGGADDDVLTLTDNVSGLSIDLGAGSNQLSLADGANAVGLTNVAFVNGSDFSGSSDDSLTLLNNVSGVSVNLGNGVNTISLAAGVNVLGDIYNIASVNGSASADSLTLAGVVAGPGGFVTIDLGGGTDTLSLAGPTGASVIVANVEAVDGSAFNDNIQLTSGSTVTGGLGADILTASNGVDHFRYTEVADSTVGNSDQIVGFDALVDRFVFDDLTSLSGPINFIGTAAFNGGSAEARLQGTTLQIDVDGDGQMTAGDIEIQLFNLSGTLSGANFSPSGFVNHPPTDINLSNLAVAENSASNTVVGVLLAADPDAGDNATFSLTDDAGGLFAVDGDNLVITGPLDHEAGGGSYQVTVRATDGGGSHYDKQFTITVTDVNESPTDIALSNATIAENSAVNAVIGSLSASDPDIGDGSTFVLIDDAGGLFAVDGTNLIVAGALDYEAATSHQITVRVTDGGGNTFDKQFTIAISDVGGVTLVGSAGADSLLGTSEEDSLQGLAGSDILQGFAGNDSLDGGADLDRAVYSDAAGGITVNLAAGIVSGAGVGVDTLLSVELVSGGAFADSYNAVGFSGASANAGSSGSFNEFEGRGGDDIIIGNGATRVSYLNAAAAVTVNIAAGTGFGTAGGDVAGVGTDSFSGVSQVRGSAYDDSLLGSSGNDQFEGRGGSDLISGGFGNDRARYDFETAAIQVNLAAGNVSGGDAGVGGFDTLQSIELIRGTAFDDSYNATGFGGGSANAGSNGSFNEFEGLGGNDTITGNGNTQIAFYNATAAVTVDLLAGTATGDASVGADTITGGVLMVAGSQFNDTIYGRSTASNIAETFDGRAGNDYIDGRGGFDKVVYNNDGAVTAGITVDMAAGTVTGDAAIGTDTLVAVESVRGTNFADTYVATGFNGASTDTIPLGTTFNEFEGMGGNDSITGNGNTRISFASTSGGVTVDLVSGTATGDGSVGTDTFTGVSRVRGGSGGDTILGDANNNALEGQNGNDVLQGRGGNDTLNGGADIDRAVYTDATGSLTVNMAAGTVSGAGIGTDTLLSIELVTGSDFADAYVATGFSGGSTNAGSNGTFNEFEGRGGNDTITGNGSTRVSYLSAAAAVSVSLAAGTGQGLAGGDLANVGVDTFTGVNAARGSAFDDALTGSNAGGEQFEGRGGNDTINGLGGTDRARYEFESSGIQVNLAAGTVAGGDAAPGGHDTLLSIEMIRGSNFGDLFDATGFSGASANAGSNGNFNEFEGMGGNDTITGNGNTQLAFYNATGGVAVDLTAGTVTGDASVGSDTIMGGVNSIVGSQFNDAITGSDTPNLVAEQFEGRAGNDVIDGRGGFDRAVYGNDSAVTSGIAVDMAAGTVTGDAAIGTDTLISVEAVRGTNFADTYVATGYSGASTDTIPLGATFNEFEGMGGNDSITGNGNTRISYANASGAVTVDLANGTASGDGSVGTDTFTGVNRVRGSNGNDVISGDASDNVLEGQNGNDTLEGRGGNDLLTGGAGSDLFVFNTGFGADTISDFSAGSSGGHDVIDFATDLFADYSAVSAAMTQVGADVVISHGADSISILNVMAGNLVAADFIFH